MLSDPAHEVALVTGASRGIGAVVAQRLAQRGVDLAINYRSKAPRAEAVAAEIRACGCQAMLVRADLTCAEDLQAMAQAVEQGFGKIDILVLNASGGLEKDKPATYAMDLNLTAQVRSVDHLLPLMHAGSRIVFVTSHWAHFYHQRPVLPVYEAVAVSKRAGEDALRARIPELSERGIRLLVVSGDVIEGTITAKLLERSQPNMLATRRSQMGTLPSVEDFAQVVVDTALDASLPNGHTVFVGSTDYSAYL